MGIWERLGSVIKSYVNDHDNNDSGRYFSSRNARNGHNDPDVDAAYEELDEFLKGKDTHKKTSGAERAGGNSAGEMPGSEKKTRQVPKELWEDLAELGLSPDASAEECKEAYKKLLKIHHPDRHAGHPGNMQKATEKSSRVNAAYDRLEKWYKTMK